MLLRPSLLLAVLLAGSAFVRADGASAQTSPDRADRADRPPSITVVGEAQVHVQPDIATVTVGVTYVAPTADEAMGMVSQGLTSIIAAVRRLGVASTDIQT